MSYPLVSSYVDRNGPPVCPENRGGGGGAAGGIPVGSSSSIGGGGVGTNPPSGGRYANLPPPRPVGNLCMDDPTPQKFPQATERQCYACESSNPCASQDKKSSCPMTPPLYSDLGKQARDVFGKGYHFGLIKLDVKTKTSTGVEFATSGVSNLDTGNVFGSLESKYKFKDYGITFTEKWNTDNVLSSEIALADFCDGAKVSLDTSFTPQTGDKSLKMKAEYKNETIALNLDTDFKHGGPLLRGAAVLGYNGLLCGYQTAFDGSKSKIIENKVSMGFIGKDFVLNSSINAGQVFSGSVHHKVNPKLETGVMLSWAADSNDTDFGIGAKYSLDSDTTVRFKVNNQSIIGLGYQQRIKPGITMFLSAQVNGKSINEGGHKIGFALELEA